MQEGQNLPRRRKSGRRKGANAERTIFALLTSELQLAKPLQRNFNQARDGGADDADQLPGWAIEVKHVAKLARPTWWRQAIRQAQGVGRQPVLFYRLRKARGAPETAAWRAVVPVAALTCLPSMDAVHEVFCEAVHGADVSFDAAVQVLRAPVRP